MKEDGVALNPHRCFCNAFALMYPRRCGHMSEMAADCWHYVFAEQYLLCHRADVIKK